MNVNDIGFRPTDILAPKQVDLKKWSVVACDQYTSQPEYWARVRAFVGDAPSTLHLMLPEAELEQGDPAQINACMRRYLDQGVFRTFSDSLIYVNRTLSDGKVRQGLIGALDLECYDYHKGASSLCRATEGTVEERLPPRIKIREGAVLEMPHIMVLIDDPAFTVIEALQPKRCEFQKIYDFDLMEDGGHLRGYAIKTAQCKPILNALAALTGNEPHPMLYAMGDGNHSLATAKACYEQLKTQLGDAAKQHPARYCLVELTNLHSPALEFEPIHRVVFDADPDDLLRFLKAQGFEEGDAHPQRLTLVRNGVHTHYSFRKESAKLTVGTLQNALDEYLRSAPGRVDYIHGAEVVGSLCETKDTLGFIVPGIEKSDLFPTVIADGALPRKTFSMGHAQDKRFYLECRRITAE